MRMLINYVSREISFTLHEFRHHTITFIISNNVIIDYVNNTVMVNNRKGLRLTFDKGTISHLFGGRYFTLKLLYAKIYIYIDACTDYIISYDNGVQVYKIEFEKNSRI